MSAAILTITPNPPHIASAVWLGAAGLSVCGLFIVEYFPIKAFPIADKDMLDLVATRKPYDVGGVLAIALASPVVIVLWSSVLFLIGVVDYVVEIPFGGSKYKVLALIPVGFGLCTTCAIVVIGEIIGQYLDAHVNLF